MLLFATDPCLTYVLKSEASLLFQQLLGVCVQYSVCSDKTESAKAAVLHSDTVRAFWSAAATLCSAAPLGHWASYSPYLLSDVPNQTVPLFKFLRRALWKSLSDLPFRALESVCPMPTAEVK